MIRICRGSEPPDLQAVRRVRMAAAQLAWADELDLSAYLTGYNVAGVRDSLYRAQHAKCAYCERQLGREAQPIEHFRPKGGVERLRAINPELWKSEEGSYWWLTWSWCNLLLGCATCNSQSRKGNKFPLRIGTEGLPLPSREPAVTLPSASFDLAVEQRLLVDPAVDDPFEHIEWRPLNHHKERRRELWHWRPIHKTDRGRWTIRILGLDRDVADHVGERIRRDVLPRTNMVRSLAEQGQADAAQRVWATLLCDLFAPKMPYQAAVYCALDWLITVEERTRWKLDCPGRPGRTDTRSSQVPADLIEAEDVCRLSPRLQLQIRAAGHHAGRHAIDVHREQPTMSAAEIARALGVARDTVRRYLRNDKKR